MYSHVRTILRISRKYPENSVLWPSFEIDDCIVWRFRHHIPVLGDTPVSCNLTFSSTSYLFPTNYKFYIITYLISYLLSVVKIVNSFSHYSEISKRSTTEIYVVRNEFQAVIRFVRER